MRVAMAWMMRASVGVGAFLGRVASVGADAGKTEAVAGVKRLTPKKQIEKRNLFITIHLKAPATHSSPLEVFAPQRMLEEPFLRY